MEQAVGRRWRGLVAVSPPPSFASLVHDHAADIRRVLAALVDDSARVDDLLQETFARACAAYPTTLPDDPRAWLRRIAVHAARDEHRAGWQRRVDVGEPPEDALTEPQTPEAAWLRTEQARQVRAAVAALPAEAGEAVRLHFLLGLTYAAAAELTGVPESTLRSRVQTAMPRLRARLADWFEES